MILGSGDRWKYRAEVRERAGSDDTLFRFHFPTGLLSKRMSARELAIFLLPHMPSMVYLFNDRPGLQAEFVALVNRIANAPDEVVSWAVPTLRQEEDDIITVALGRQTVQAGPTWFVGACG